MICVCGPMDKSSVKGRWRFHLLLSPSHNTEEVNPAGAVGTLVSTHICYCTSDGWIVSMSKEEEAPSMLQPTWWLLPIAVHKVGVRLMWQKEFHQGRLQHKDNFSQNCHAVSINKYTGYWEHIRKCQGCLGPISKYPGLKSIAKHPRCWGPLANI